MTKLLEVLVTIRCSVPLFICCQLWVALFGWRCKHICLCTQHSWVSVLHAKCSLIVVWFCHLLAQSCALVHKPKTGVPFLLINVCCVKHATCQARMQSSPSVLPTGQPGTLVSLQTKYGWNHPWHLSRLVCVCLHDEIIRHNWSTWLNYTRKSIHNWFHLTICGQLTCVRRFHFGSGKTGKNVVA